MALLEAEAVCEQKSHKQLLIIKNDESPAEIYSSIKPCKHQLKEVHVRISHKDDWVLCPEDIQLLLSVDKFCYKIIKFCCVDNIPETQSNQLEPASKKNAFDILMSKKEFFPQEKQNSGNYYDLYRDFCHFVTSEKGCRWYSQDTADRAVTPVWKALWYVSEQHIVFQSASEHKAGVRKIPDIFGKFQGYNDFKRKKEKQIQVSQMNLKAHAEALYTALDPFKMGNKEASEFSKHIKDLADCLLAYGKHLAAPKTNQRKDMPISSENIRVFNVKKSDTVHDSYIAIKKDLDETPYNEPLRLEFNRHYPAKCCDNVLRYRFIENIQSTDDTIVLKYSPGGSAASVVYLWKLRPGTSAGERQNITARNVAILQPMLPKYFSKTEKKDIRTRQESQLLSVS